MGEATAVRGLDFKRLFETAPSASIVLTPDLIVAAVSDAYLAVTHSKRAQVEGRNLFEIFPEASDSGSKGSASRIQDSLKTVLRTGKPHIIDRVRYDILGPDRKLEEHYWRLVSEPIFGSDAEVAFISHHVTDITELVRLQASEEAERERAFQAEAALEDERAHLVNTLETAEIATWRYDVATNRTYGSARLQFYFGLSDEVASGGDLGDYIQAIHEEDRERVTEAIKASLETGDRYGVEYRVTGADGKLRWVLARGHADMDRHGKAHTLAGVLVDITDHKAAETDREQLLAELEVERQKLRYLFSHSPALKAVLLGPELVFDYVNEPFYSLVGVRDLIGKPFMDAMPELVEQGYIDSIKDVFLTGEPLRLDEVGWWLRRAADHTIEQRVVSVTFQPLREADGRITGLYFHGIDITDESLARRELAAERQQFRDLLDSVPAHLVTLRGPDLRYEFANREFLRFIGKSEVIGLRVEEGWPVPPDHVELLKSLMRTGEALSGREAPVPSPVDGSLGYYDFVFQPMRNASGVVDGIFVHSLDVTEKVLARKEVAASEQRLREIFDKAPAFTAVLRGENLVFEFVNDEYYKLVGHREVIGKPVREALPEIAGQGYFEALTEVYRTGESFGGRALPVQIQRTPGGPLEERFVNLLYQALQEPDGSISGVFAHGVDVTDQVVARRQMENLNAELERRVQERTETLVQKNLELEGFTYSISHDMRAPLRAIVANAHIVLEEEGASLTPEGRYSLERLAAGALHISELVEDLLQYARLGTRDLRKEHVDLTELVGQSIADVAREYPECDIHVEVEPGLQAYVDPRILAMALHNLLDNACKYSGDKAVAFVQFGCKQIGEERIYFVKDNGIGFDMKYAEKLFKPFERLHGSEFPGTGIGLANVRRAIERHGGRIWAESEIGHGATFFFTLE